MELEFRHLRVVRAVARRGGLTAAARELAMTQPSVSEALRQAERITGGALFERGPNGATATPLGEVVLGHAEVVLTKLERLEQAVRQHGSGPLRFACTAAVLATCLVDLAPRVLGRAAEVHNVIDLEAPFELLSDGRIEAALVIDLPGHEHAHSPEFGRYVVAMEPTFIAVSERHPLAGRGEVELAELAGERWLLRKRVRGRMTQYMQGVCASAGFEPDVLELDLVDLFPLAESNSGVLPIMPAHRPRPGVAFLSLVGTPLWAYTSLVWDPGGQLARSEVEDLWSGLVRTQHEVIETGSSYQSWLQGHPEWSTTPPEPTSHYDPRSR